MASAAAGGCQSAMERMRVAGWESDQNCGEGVVEEDKKKKKTSKLKVSGDLDAEKEEEEKKEMLMQRVSGDLGGSISLLLMAATMTVMTVMMVPGGRTLGSVGFFCGTLDATVAILRAIAIVRIMKRQKK